MKLFVALIFLSVLATCYGSPCSSQGDKGGADIEEGATVGSEDYVVDEKTHRIGGGFNLGANLGLNIGKGKNGFHAGLQKGLNFDWNGYAGTRTSHLRRQRPIFGFNPFRNQRRSRYPDEDDY